MAIPVETLQNADVVARYPLQRIAEARQFRDQLNQDGASAFMVRSEGGLRYDGEIWVMVPKRKQIA